MNMFHVASLIYMLSKNFQTTQENGSPCTIDYPINLSQTDSSHYGDIQEYSR